MKIHGKERKFMLTVGASMDIADLCPHGDITKLGEVIAKGSYAEQMRMTLKLALIMNHGYEDNRAFEEEGYKADYITEDELRTLKPGEISELSDAILNAYRGDIQGEIELEPEKKTD